MCHIRFCGLSLAPRPARFLLLAPTSSVVSCLLCSTPRAPMGNEFSSGPNRLALGALFHVLRCTSPRFPVVFVTRTVMLLFFTVGDVV